MVDGSRTVSGFPLLANDPHLNARLPSIWYLAHLSAGDYDAIGASFPGTPGIILGRNRSIAWGATNVAADVEDLYREQIDPSGKLADTVASWNRFRSFPKRSAFEGETMSISTSGSRATVRWCLMRSTRTTSEPHPSQTGVSAAGAAGISMDGARRRRHHAGCDAQNQRGSQLVRFHRGTSRFRRPVAELRLRRHRGPYRLLRARSHSHSLER